MRNAPFRSPPQVVWGLTAERWQPACGSELVAGEVMAAVVKGGAAEAGSRRSRSGGGTMVTARSAETGSAVSWAVAVVEEVATASLG